VKRVDECATLHELFENCLPAFGGAYLRRIYRILDAAIGMGCPLTLAISGPITVSGQHQTWLIPPHGEAYDPVKNAWTALPRSPLRGRVAPAAVWTGTSMLIWGGFTEGRDFADGAAFSPGTA
jgi:hypothetical protein